MNESDALSRKAVFLGPGEGRSYPMGRIAAVFKADESESESRYSISEWWLEPHTQGPGPHSHPHTRRVRGRNAGRARRTVSERIYAVCSEAEVQRDRRREDQHC